MFVNIAFDTPATDLDIIDVPAVIFNNIAALHEDFCKWLMDKNSNHDYWVFKNGEKSYLSYETEAFVLWINNNVLANESEKATIAQAKTGKAISDSPTIYF